MTIVVHQGIQFTEAMLAEESLGSLLSTYNKIAKEHGEKTVSKFSDKKSAIRRVWAMLQRHGKTAKAARSRPEGARARSKRFNFVAIGQPKPSREDTPENPVLRNRVLQGLLRPEGLSFNQAVDIVNEFDAYRRRIKRPVRNNGKTVETRAYEALRLVHYYSNYSMKQDGDGDDAPIRIVGNRRS